jgi:hypothetical protein
VQRLGEFAADDDAGLRARDDDVLHGRVHLFEERLEVRAFEIQLAARAQTDRLFWPEPLEQLRLLEVLELADLQILNQVDDAANAARVHAAQEHTGGVGGARGHGFSAHERCCRLHTWHQAQLVEQAAIVGNASGTLGFDADVRVVAQDLAFEVCPEAAHDRDHGAQGEGAQEHSRNRQHADDGQKSAAMSAYVTGGDEGNEATMLDAVEQKRYREGHETHDECRARQCGSHAHNLMPENEVGATWLG